MKETMTSEDRVLKLSNGKEVNPAEVERHIEDVCHYVKYSVVEGNGKEKPVALIFPDEKLLTHPDYLVTPEEGCFCPRNVDELRMCLRGCLTIVNNRLEHKLKCAAIISADSSSDNKGTELSPEGAAAKYKTLLQKMYTESTPSDKAVCMVRLNNR